MKKQYNNNALTSNDTKYVSKYIYLFFETPCAHKERRDIATSSRLSSDILESRYFFCIHVCLVTLWEIV